MNAMEKIGPDYSYWSNALAGNFGPVHDGDPQPGFYRKRTGKAAGYVPVAIWEQDGKILALVDGKQADAGEIWTYVCPYPILEEWYRARMAGQPWPDEDAAVTASLTIPDSALRPFRDTGYRVSSAGHVKGPKGTILTPRPNDQGYLRVQISGQGDEYVHRMVAVAFHGEPPTEDSQVDHINSVRGDNRAENLRWVTKEENLADRDQARGEEHHAAKMTEARVRIIREGALYPGRDNDLAAAFEVSRETVRDIRLGKGWTHVRPTPGIGDNNPPTDEAEVLQSQIEAASAGAAQYAEINDDGTASKAQSLRSRLLELSGNADKLREDRKRPHLEAGKTIDAKFMPLVKTAKTAADAIRNALGAHETRKAREAERIRREAEQARMKAEQEAVRKRLEAEAAAREAEKAGQPAPTPVIEPEPIPEPPAPAPVPEAAVAIRGAYGRAAAVKVVKVAKVVDQDAAYMALRTHKELVELIAKLAQRAATAGVEVAGVEVIEERAVA